MKRNQVLLYSCIFLSLFLFTSCFDEDEIVPPIETLSVKCIWDKAPHSAFTDLIEYNGKYYCCFREGEFHISTSEENYGKIRILESLDGDTWYSIGLIEDRQFDLRDPKFSITPDNKLMVLYGCITFSNNKTVFQGTKISLFSNQRDQLQIIESQTISVEDNPTFNKYWLWRIKYYKGSYYGVAYQEGKIPILVKSNDGINYKKILELTFAPNGNEADVDFFDDEQMIIIIRTNGENGHIATASYPYKDWDSKKLDEMLHCPKILKVGVDHYVVGRSIDGLGLLKLELNNKLTTVLALSAVGDRAYPGMIQVKDELWISYYLSPDKTSIYLAKLKITALTNKQ